MTILIVDGHNMFHRARSGFTAGDYAVVYNFFRGFRAQVEKFEPSRVYVTLEGHPKARYTALPEYKANRVETGDVADPVFMKKVAETKKFFKQVDIITDLLSNHFPVSVVRHEDYEADDVVFNIINRSSTSADFTVMSNDSDFTQLLDQFKNVKVYNPMQKCFVEAPDYDYVTWKALRGDGSDNIPGIVGDKTAEKLVLDPEALAKFLMVEENARIFTRNHELISFMKWSDEDAMKMTCSNPTKNWDVVHDRFKSFYFKSITEEKAWNKFVATFEHLWGE